MLVQKWEVRAREEEQWESMGRDAMGKVNTGLAKLFVLLQIEACPRQKRAAFRTVFRAFNRLAGASLSMV